MDFNDNELSRMSRRRFIRVASAAGVSLACLEYGTREGLVQAAEGEEVPYVRYLEGTGEDREPVYASIPREAWARRQTAKDLAERVDKRLRNRFGKEVKVYWGVMEDSPTGFGVYVDYNIVRGSDGPKYEPEPSMEEVRSVAPRKGKGTAAKGEHKETREHIPVRVEKSYQQHVDCEPCPSHQDYYDTYYGWTFVPAGIAIDHGSGSGKSFASLCAPFQLDDGTNGYAGSGHASTEGEAVYCEGGAEPIGTCTKSFVGLFSDEDYCFIEQDGSHYGSLKVRKENTDQDEYDIVGIITNTGLENSVGDFFYGQGRASSRSYDALEKMKTGGNGAIFDHDVDCGDSGGPMFELTNLDESVPDVYIAGNIVARRNDTDSDDCGDDTLVNTAESMEIGIGGEFRTA